MLDEQSVSDRWRFWKNGRRRFDGVSLRIGLTVWIVFFLRFTQPTLWADQPVYQGSISSYRGYQRYDSSVDGCRTIVVVPHKVAIGRPWIWRAEFFDAFPQVDVGLLEKGFHLVYIDVGNTFGCPDAMQHWNAYYKFLTENYRLSPKPVLEGLSRGGLYCFNWASENADKVSCILVDNAVLDFKSWPGGKGTSRGSPGDWQKLLNDYHFSSEAEALAYQKNPIDRLEPLAKANVPLFLLCNDADDVVPYSENSAIVKDRYLKLGGRVSELMKHHLGHHPHGLADPTPVVDFIVKQALPAGTRVTTSARVQARPADAFVDSIGINVHLGYVDTSYAKFREIVKPRLQELGVRHIRDGCPLLDGNDDQHAKLKDLAQDGIRSLLICSPKFGSLDQIIESLKKASSSVEAVEGPNEPDGEGFNYKDQLFPTVVRVYQEDFYAAVKQNPTLGELQVVVSALSNPENAPKVGALTPVSDFANTHSYADGGPPGFEWDWYMDRCRIVCSRPVAVTETGYHNAVSHTDNLWIPGISEAAAGKYISRLFAEYFVRGIARTYLYELLDERDDPRNAESGFGILRVDGRPKPAFHAIKNTISLLSDPGAPVVPQTLAFEITSENALVKYLLLQKRSGQYSLLIWQNVVSFDLKSQQDLQVPLQTVTIEFDQPIQSATSYWPLRGTEVVQRFSPGRSLKVELPDHLMILQFAVE